MSNRKDLNLRRPRSSKDTRALLTGRVGSLAEDHFVLGHKGARIYFGVINLAPLLKVGDMVAVVTSRVGTKNVAEQITHVRPPRVIERVPAQD